MDEADEATCLYVDEGLFMRNWRKADVPAKDHKYYRQDSEVLPRLHREAVIKTAHEDVTAHLGARKTGDAVPRYFFWPGMLNDIKAFC